MLGDGDKNGAEATDNGEIAGEWDGENVGEIDGTNPTSVATGDGDSAAAGSEERLFLFL